MMALAGCGRIAFDLRDDGGLSSDWWDPAWAYRKVLVIDHTKVAGDLVDFPVLVQHPDAEITAHARPDGKDIAFVDAQNQALDYELERYDGTTVVAWVRI